MANQVQLQSDIGTIGIQGLGAFSRVLAILSADDIVPMALVQMEKLGMNLQTSGQFAGKVPDYLQRFSTQSLDRLATAVGWRKGDSASLLANSAGGQAAALLSVVLGNLFNVNQCGEILSQLCSRLLPPESSVASVLQLADFADLLAQKLFPLGFGNFLPAQVVRIHHVYRSLGIEPPIDLLDSLTVDAMVDLLESICQALCDESKIVRISGSFATGHIYGLLLFMFPHDAVISVEDIIIHEGERKSIHLELRRHPPGPVAISVESTLNETSPFHHSIKIEGQSTEFEPQYHFAWEGCIAKALELAFLQVSSVCTQDILAAFCDLLVAISNVEITDHNFRDLNNIPQKRLIALLGLHPHRKMETACQTVVGTAPTSYSVDIGTAFPSFAKMVESAVGVKNCTCARKCAFAKGWVEARDKSKKSCRIHRMWTAVGQILSAGVTSFFINPKPDATIPVYQNCSNVAQDLIMGALIDQRAAPKSTQSFYADVFSCFGERDPDSFATLLASSYGSTIYCTVLESLHVSCDSGVSFELVNGRLIFKERYYDTLSSATTTPRKRARKSLTEKQSKIMPSSIGEHDGLPMTVRETASGLELRTTARRAGSNVHLNLSEIIQASLSLERTPACSHPSRNPLSSSPLEVVTTGISAPCSTRNSIAIALTAANPTAQLLCCVPGVRMVLMQDCCLDCAIEEAIVGLYSMVIVS